MNKTATVLASSAKTATWTSDNYKNDGAARGIIVYLDVTTASGSGGVQITVQGYDPTSTNSVGLHTATTAVVATGTKAYVLYPGASSAGTASFSVPLPPVFNIKFTHGNSDNYVYSASYALLP